MKAKKKGPKSATDILWDAADKATEQCCAGCVTLDALLMAGHLAHTVGLTKAQALGVVADGWKDAEEDKKRN